MSLAQFAFVLQNQLPGYVKASINDSTGIEGYWDFSINFSGVNLRPGGVFDPNAGSQTTDPNGSLSLPDATQRQLGLKLEMGKWIPLV